MFCLTSWGAIVLRRLHSRPLKLLYEPMQMASQNSPRVPENVTSFVATVEANEAVYAQALLDPNQKKVMDSEKVAFTRL